MPAALSEYLDASVATLAAMRGDAALQASFAAALPRCIEALRAGAKLIFAGNGGSAGDAQHLAGELVGRFFHDRPPIAALALGTDAATSSAIGNDYGYEQGLARQMEALGREGDVLIALSTSGNSANLLRAMEAARRLGISTIGFTGRDGGAMAALCDVELRVPSMVTPLIQQGHMVLGHLLCAGIEAALYPRD